MIALKPPSFFGKAKRHEILDFLAYRPRRLGANVVSIPTERGPLLTQISTDLHPTCATLGDLEPLPLELFNEILRYSDLQTASAFRSLNRRARAAVKSSFHYKLILLKAPQAVAALEKTGIASHFSVNDLFHAFSTPSCHVCGQFGTYLWIPECVRCCLPCMSKPKLLPMTERDARAAFGLTKSGLKGVPIMATLPGIYTSFQRPYSRKRYLLSRERARQAAVDIHGEEELAEYVNNGTSNAKIAYDQRVAKRGRAVNDPTRFMSVVPLPYLDSGLRITRAGLAC